MNEKQLGQIRLTTTTATTAYSFGLLTGLDVDTIDWQYSNFIRYTFNATPDLSNVKPGMFIQVASATNSSNNGVFEITEVDDANDWVQVFNENRNDATDDEASDSPATVSIKPSKNVNVVSIVLCNTSSSDILYSVFHDDDGSTYDETTAIVYEETLSGGVNKTEPLKLGIYSDNADMNIGVSTNSANDLTATLYGSEL